MIALAFCCILASMPAEQGKLVYPTTKKVNVVETLHGVQVADPYRWLEEMDSPEVKDWVRRQNELTFAYLRSIPGRDRIRKRLTELWNYERYGIPFKEGGRYFFTKNDGLQNQSVLYWAESLDAKPKVLLDPNKLSKDGTVALSGIAVSPDGKYLAYGTSSGGSDWQEWHVREVASGKDLKDHLKWIKFSGASWTKDGKGFFYSRYDEPKSGKDLAEANYYQKLYYHRLGDPQEKDTLVYHRPDQKEWGFSGEVTEDGRFLVITVWRGTDRRNGVFVKRLDVPNAEVVELLAEFDAQYSFVGNVGDMLYFLTDKNAPLGRVIRIHVLHPEPENHMVVIPEKQETLDGVHIVGGKIIAHYLKDAHSFVRVYALDGLFETTIALPGLGTASGFAGKPEDPETFFSYMSFNSPPTIYRYDVATRKRTVFRQPKLKGYDGSQFEVKQVFYTSKDGTRIPMFLAYKKGIKPDGQNPTLLYGYGGFQISQTPWYSTAYTVWMEMGGVLAVANLRGGGEYGSAWHDAGRLKNKQNVFDDFIAAAEYLIEQKYTNPSRLAIQGGSNGGLLVGAVLNQRPDLFGAALPSVGVMDMLRFHKFTIGWAWVSDYGSPDDAEYFKILYAYSPYHNLKPQKYPAVLVTTADHDDRVVPAHSYKYIARLQEVQQGDAPVLIRIETRAGHGAGKPISKVIEETTDEWAFLVKNLKMSVKGLK
ncbi:MAG: prolyl endopeptidase [Fimbriimonadales bacterium]|nr:MAG: prolyl endopeptidase [Fimbriimonadales bacterium]